MSIDSSCEHCNEGEAKTRTLFFNGEKLYLCPACRQAYRVKLHRERVLTMAALSIQEVNIL